ncbi:uncharacterized protein LOC115623667 [Scaptodrosophila lebanonensis]|uniref:Uncharacterized protein LOC115623667 n=1 Tax=Drosophila lebanonensis TaxID=7225 RepID=A0A6J2TDC1_DROLE|nr:uncharacterized protein LOC115623667 [Scaptodrosophila lebanonensis]
MATIKLQFTFSKAHKTMDLRPNLKRHYSEYRTFCFYFGIVLLNLIKVPHVLCKPDVTSTGGENMQNYANVSLALADNDEELGPPIWSQFLEDYTLSHSSRTSKDLPFYSPAYKRPGNNNNIYVTRRIGEAVELEPNLRKPAESTLSMGNQQFRPMTNQMLQQQQQQRQQPGFLQQFFGFGGSNNDVNPPPHHQSPHLRPVPLQQPPGQHLSGPTNTFRAVSENDLYLLGAIEKLSYRADYLESRIRRAEQLIYYLMAGNNQKEVRDPCPANFTRVNDNCYYINSHQQVNWKTANSACKALHAHLAEFENSDAENEAIMAYLLNQPNHRGRDYWLGGLNPGLLWIWANSAKPVNPVNLTTIATMSQKGENVTSTNLVDDGVAKKETDASAILNNTVEIEGQGRCLRLKYDSTKHSYHYYGQECTSRQHYICEYEDKTLDNKIKKIARQLQLFN